MLPRSRELALVLVLALAPRVHAEAPDAKPQDSPGADAKGADTKAPDDAQAGPFGFHKGSKEPITITSDNLEYQYKDGIVIYRGDVLAVQGDVKVKSNELRIVLAKSDDAKDGKNGKDAKDAKDGKGKDPAKDATDLGDTSTQKVQSIVASGSVRIDQGTRWAVGGKATFEQSNRTLVLTENPVLHDGPNEVAGDRVVVFLDEDRSIVEGGRKRVKAVLFPGKENGTGGKPGDKNQTAKTSTAEPSQ